MIALRLHPQRIALRSPLVTAVGRIGERRLWLVEARQDGISGWGEAAPLAGFGGEPPELCELALTRAVADPSARHAATRSAPCAQAAIDDALADLAARIAGTPLATGTVAVNALATGDDEAVALARAGAGTIKLKSCGDPAVDAARLHALHDRARGVRWRLDANGSWDPAGAMAFARLAGRLVEYVEQPLPAGDLDGCARLRNHGLRIALDEGVRTPTDVARAIASQACDAIVLKPNWIGGAGPATDLVVLAGSSVEVVLSSALGTAVERMHAAHLAARLGLRGPHGLATGGLLERDVASLPMAGPWRIALPGTPGLGLAVQPC